MDAVAQRREKIVMLVDERGYMTIEELGAVLRMSQATLRFDLEALALAGKLVRLRGVAITKKVLGVAGVTRGGASLTKTAMAAEKRIVAQACMSLFAPKQTVFLDASDTNWHVAHEMRQATHMPLTVVTNSLDIFEVLRECGHISAVLVGGDYEAATHSLVGDVAIDFLAHFYAHFALLTPRGVDPQKGIRLYYTRNTSIKRSMHERSQCTVVVLDESKFAEIGVATLMGWGDVDVLVTNKMPPEPYPTIFKENGIRLVLP